VDRFGLRPEWTSISAASLLGWLIFLTVSFILLLAVSIGLSNLGVRVIYGSIGFLVEAILIGATALSIAIPVSMRFFAWITKREAVSRYTLLMILVGLTILFFPRSFGFLVE
jgi:hypothetical protein